VNRLIIKRLVQVTVSTLIVAFLLFISSGRIDWAMAWAYVAVSVGIVVINALVILPRNPDLIAERAGVGENTKGWDRTLTKFFVIPYFGTFLIAGLDNRFGWSPQFALATQLAALVFVVAGYGLVSWAMMSNKFFSTSVRIQKERGHTVVTTGPYQYVRHPGYIGMIAYTLATPLMLGSLWALILGALTAGMFIARTSLEDKTLQEELDGYSDYALHVRYRLMPKIW
jgi:protein-S-isoprenylcysteine O-methyltransferase Ste14